MPTKNYHPHQKPLHGLLLVYYYSVCLFILIHLSAILWLWKEIIAGVPQMLSFLFFSMDLLFSTVIYANILKTLHIKSPSTPNRIVILNLYMLVSAILAFALSWIFDDVLLGVMHFKGSSPTKYLGKSLVPFLVISAYLKESKQVQKHYTKNADLSFL